MWVNFTRIVATLREAGAGAFSPALAPAKKSGYGRLRLHNTGPDPVKAIYY